jgi:hypothetical protein
VLNGWQCIAAYGVTARREDGGDFGNQRWKMILGWAKVGRDDWAAARPVLEKTKENGVGCSKDFGPN